MSNLKEKIDVLENQSWDLDLVIGQVNNKTKEIKYNDVPMNIYIAIQNLAEENMDAKPPPKTRLGKLGRNPSVAIQDRPFASKKIASMLLTVGDTNMA